VFVARSLEQGTLFVVIVRTAGQQVFVSCCIQTQLKQSGFVKVPSETTSGTLKWACPAVLYQVTEQTTEEQVLFGHKHTVALVKTALNGVFVFHIVAGAICNCK
jgi:hypothetical protein